MEGVLRAGRRAAVEVPVTGDLPGTEHRQVTVERRVSQQVN